MSSSGRARPGQSKTTRGRAYARVPPGVDLVVLSIRIPAPLHKQVRQVAEAQRWSFSAAAVALLEEAIAARQERDMRLLEEAMAAQHHPPSPFPPDPDS